MSVGCALSPSACHFPRVKSRDKPSRHVDAEQRSREEEADLGARHRRRRERRELQEDVQQAPALHPGERPQCRHEPRLLLRPGPQRQGQPRVTVDPHPAVLLRERSEGTRLSPALPLPPSRIIIPSNLRFPAKSPSRCRRPLLLSVSFYFDLSVTLVKA